jgi:signal transduction histidine kinase
MSTFITTIFLMIFCSVSFAQNYEFKDTQELVSLVNNAAELVRVQGEKAFQEFSQEGSPWRKKDKYVFVLDQKGEMIVHPDQALKGKNTLNLKDINGRPIIKGLLEAATTFPEKAEGWYHYQWPIPGELQPRWKSSFVKLIKTPAGANYIVGSGMYTEKMEKSFVQDMVKDAAALIEQKGKEAFKVFHDETGRFRAKDSYVFVIDPKGVELVNPAFPNLEGRNLLSLKDSENKELVKEMLKIAHSSGSGWVNYMWPKPGESVPTEKSTYVQKVKVGNEWLVVGSGVYLADAPKSKRSVSEMSAPELVKLVREGAALLQEEGEKSYDQFKKKGSKWFKGDTYFFIWNMDGVRTLHAADPTLVGKNGAMEKDIQGRPYGEMFLQAVNNSAGEGWVHYMYPYPNQIFPAWKSAFLKKVILPSGKKQIIGSASYQMQMDEALIQDVVNRASELIKEKGAEAFETLREKKGPFYFMDVYVFVETPEGVSLVNPGQPYVEGKNISELKDARGNMVVKDYIAAAMKNGKAWTEYYWYRPDESEPTLKRTFVQKVEVGKNTYIVGSGMYVDKGTRMAEEEKIP